MALAHRINKAKFEKLSAELQAEYKADGEEFVLDVTGLEDTGALKRAKDREKQRADDLQKIYDELSDKYDALEGDDARKNKDIATLEKRWLKDKNDAVQAVKDELEPQVAKLTKFAAKNLVDSQAALMASEITKTPSGAKLILPHIKSRMVADLESDEPTTVILGADGKASKLTYENLRDEFVANKDYADIIKTTQASGGASKTQNGGGAPNQQFNDDQQKPADLSKSSPKDLAARITESKAQA